VPYRVVILPYDPTWPASFFALGHTLRAGERMAREEWRSVCAASGVLKYALPMLGFIYIIQHGFTFLLHPYRDAVRQCPRRRRNKRL
jgi:hypothetical protein